MSILKKISVDARMIFSSGIGTYLFNNLLKIVDKLDAEFILLGNKSELCKIFTKATVGFADVDAKIYTPKEQLVLAKAIKKTDLHWSPNFNFPFFLSPKTKLIVTIHDINHLQTWFRNGSSVDKIKSHIAEFYIGYALKRAAKIITVSEFTKNQLMLTYKVSGAKINVIHLGVDHDKFNTSYTDIQIDEVKARYGLTGNYLIYLGNIKPHKNLIKLVLSYSLLDHQLLDQYHLVIAGEFDRFAGRHKALYDLLDSLPEEVRKNIKFTGFIEEHDLPVLLKGAKLMVFPSLYEGFGLPPLEAMACGCPVVASNLASIPEVCNDAAMYFDPYDEISMKDAITLLLQNPALRQSYIDKGLTHVAKFQWTFSADKHLEIFKEVLNY